ncbi:MAG TPA: alpha/beta fold hydrolase [Acidimicrobiales bacterium]|nr:alpha/beta fold hydrolase [Acidimicrobiales bacterium]
MGETRRGRVAAVVMVVGLLAAACSGGGGDNDIQDLRLGQGETILQFEGADKVRLGGTLQMPVRAGEGPVGAVLIVPSMARNDRNGYIDVVPGDPIYQDLSTAITGAGLAAFRYDRRSMGVSKLEPDKLQFSFEDAVTDAHEALLFLSQRSGIDASNLAIVGHDLGGIAAMKVAATDDKVKGVVLLSTPGRPLVDVLAGDFQATFGAESAQAFRGIIGTLLATGSLPERSGIRAEHQTVLPTGNDALLRDEYALDPLAEAAKVKVPTLVVTGRQSTLVGPVDGDRLKAALPSGQSFAADTTATLQKITAALPQSFDPNDHRAHGGGRPPDTANREQAAVDQITAFLSARLPATRR